MITLLLARIFLHSQKCNLVVYSRFKKASKVCHFYFKMSDLICPNEKKSTSTKNLINNLYFKSNHQIKFIYKALLTSADISKCCTDLKPQTASNAGVEAQLGLSVGSSLSELVMAI